MNILFEPGLAGDALITLTILALSLAAAYAGAVFARKMEREGTIG